MPFEISPKFLPAVESDQLSDAIERAYLTAGCKQLIGLMYNSGDRDANSRKPRGMCVYGAYNFATTGDCMKTSPRFHEHYSRAEDLGLPIIELNNRGIGWQAIVTALRHLGL